MNQNIPLAIVLAVIASGCFATGAILQHDAVGTTFDEKAESRTLNFERVMKMLRNKWWLIGTLVIGLGALLHLIGVSLAPVTVIQPVGILAVVFSVLVAARRKRRAPSGKMWGAIACAVIGIVGFTVFSARSAAHDTEIVFGRIIVASVLVWACAAVFAVVGVKGAYRIRCLAWACGGAFIYGLATALMKTMLVVFERSGSNALHLPFLLSLAGVLTCYAVGGWLIQQGYASGPAEIVVGSMTVVDPLVAVVFGIAVLGEGANIGPLAAIGMVAMGSLASTGVFLLSKHHPDAAAAYENLNNNADAVTEEGTTR